MSSIVINMETDTLNAAPHAPERITYLVNDPCLIKIMNIDIPKIEKCSFILMILFTCFQLPIKVDIIKDPREIEGKSTAVHAAVLAPQDVKIYIYPDFPVLSKNEKVQS